jgi:hypothetical protein
MKMKDLIPPYTILVAPWFRGFDDEFRINGIIDM